ncbi:CBS domain-containing protein [Litoreibacter arenae]|uniref:Inosine-5'-monophosphate dehydrogenase n=1 Tax=Litoreibacter arenae DSM 19593 TaxID=1123360 RepID=S9QH29_9RHOB|nr:CBS domain-containing protein [Litoreibacter arenae]EPX79132.1 Inosine-5'-monophosphate dehydrogenase [Litoreibacter arenae DSM 19593]
MLVSNILKQKADDGVVTIAPGAAVSDAAKILSDRKIGSVVVSSDNKTALGILSERDIVREIGQRGSVCLSETVESMMTSKLVTCVSSDRADNILATMTEGRFRHMPVVENGEMIGLITLGDVVKARLSELAMEKDALEGMIMGH